MHNDNVSSTGKIADMADLQREAGSEQDNKAVTLLVVEDEAIMRTKLAEEVERSGGFGADKTALVMEAVRGMGTGH
jgi:hypothetical protein